MEKETLKEAAGEYANKELNAEFSKVGNFHAFSSSFIKGAEWQAERMYSEEDLFSFYEFLEEYSLRKYSNCWRRITNDPTDKPLGFKTVDDKYIIEWFRKSKKK